MPYLVLDPSTAADAPTTDAGEPSAEGTPLGEIKEDIILTLGNRTDVQVGGNLETNLLRWINYGYIHVCQMIDIKELWASVALDLVVDQPFYKVPAQLSWIKRMMLQDETDFWASGGTEMDQIDEPTYRMLPDSSLVQLAGQAVPPTKFFRFGRMAVVYPTPADEYTAVADFRVRPLPLEDDDQCPLLPPEFHEGVMLAGLYRAQRILGLRSEAAMTLNDMLTVIRPIMNSDAEERVGMHMSAQPVNTRAGLYRTPAGLED